MAKYEATRFAERGVVATVDGRPLNLRNDLFNHSPDGAEFGYSGSGPAQLALGILAHHFGAGLKTKLMRELADERAVRFHQHFKGMVLAKVDGDYFSIDTAGVEEALQRITGPRKEDRG